MATWKLTEYIAWIMNDCPVNDTIIELDLQYQDLLIISPDIVNLPNLRKLSLSNNQLTTIPDVIWNLHSLVILNLDHNELTSIPADIMNLSNLEALHISSNRLTTIPTEICHLINLKSLNISHNKLTSIPNSIGELINLKFIGLIYNQLTTIPNSIGDLINIEYLGLGFNKLITIPNSIGNITNLQFLGLGSNQLTTIPSSIGNLQYLEGLFLTNNLLTTIPAAIGNLQNLQELGIFHNPIEYLPPNVIRFLEDDNQQGVYQDEQSVHNSTIQKSIKISIMRLLSIQPIFVSESVISSILTDDTLSDGTKQSIIEYARNTDLIIELNVTFLEVLIAVWNRIITNEHSTEIKKVLIVEMADSECKCFTGRVSRLVNCLSGFDPLVEVKISDNEQIGNVIGVIRDRLKDEHRYTVELHKEIACVELKDLGYTYEVISEWLVYIE